MIPANADSREDCQSHPLLIALKRSTQKYMTGSDLPFCKTASMQPTKLRALKGPVDGHGAPANSFRGRYAR